MTAQRRARPILSIRRRGSRQAALLVLLSIVLAVPPSEADEGAIDVLDTAAYAAQPPTVAFLPECGSDCVAGQQDLGYLYSALYDRELQEVHVFVELKHAQQEPEDGSNLVDTCVITHADGQLHHRTQALGRVMFDNHVHYSSFRFICPVLERVSEEAQMWVGLGLGAITYTPRIPITEVPQKQRAQVGACLATMYGTSDTSEQTKEWLKHTRGLGMDGRFHIYLTKQDIEFDEGRQAWWRPREAGPSQTLPGVDWVHVDAFDRDHTWVSGQLLHYAHCMFYHRHVYRHILFWDTDEFLILKQPGQTLPALLDQNAGSNPIAAASAFHRFAYRAGCLRRQQNDSAKAGTGLVSLGGGERVAQEEAPWHAVYDARERHTESARSVRVRGWTHLRGQGDKLVVRPLLVDEFYIHFLRSARPGYDAQPATVPVTQAYIKHLRRYVGHDQCTSLSFVEPAPQIKAGSGLPPAHPAAPRRS